MGRLYSCGLHNDLLAISSLCAWAEAEMLGLDLRCRRAIRHCCPIRSRAFPLGGGCESAVGEARFALPVPGWPQPRFRVQSPHWKLPRQPDAYASHHGGSGPDDPPNWQQLQVPLRALRHQRGLQLTPGVCVHRRDASGGRAQDALRLLLRWLQVKVPSCRLPDIRSASAST